VFKAGVDIHGVHHWSRTLTENDPDLYYHPAYFGPAGWIGIRLDTGSNDWAHIEDWLTRSWRASAPKRLAMLPF
jgi:hypothetical protein